MTMDNDKKILDELFQYGSRILSELKSAAVKKDDDFKELTRRHEKLKQSLKNLLAEHDG